MRAAFLPDRFGLALACGLVGLSVLVAPAPIGAGAPCAREAQEGVLAPGAERRWELAARAGERWWVAAEQQGLDVELTVEPPDGSPTRVDGPFDRAGGEALTFEATADGTYRVVVRGREAGAPVGRFQLRCEPLPSPWILAAEEWTRAGVAYREGAGGRERATAAYLAAADAFAQLGERRFAARGRYAAAVLARLSGHFAEAEALARGVLADWQQLAELPLQAATLNEIGLDVWQRGAPAEAKTWFEQAHALAHEVPADSGKAYLGAGPASNRCLMDLVLGDLRAGAACYEAIRPLLDAAGAPTLDAAAWTNLGRARDLLGDPAGAAAAYRGALGASEAAGDTVAAARTRVNLAALAESTGAPQVALEHYQAARAAFEAAGEARWTARILANLGNLYQGLGDLPLAEEHQRAALARWQELEDKTGQAAVWANLGHLERARGRLDEAEVNHRRALALARALEDRRGMGFARLDLAHLTLARGQAEPALAAFQAATAELTAVGDKAGEVAARLGEGEAQLTRGNLVAATGALEAALAGAREAGLKWLEAGVHEALSRALERAGRPREALDHARAGVERLETVRAGLAARDLRTTFSARQWRLYERWIELLRQGAGGPGGEHAAFAVAERARARTLLELLAEAGAEPGELVAQREPLDVAAVAALLDPDSLLLVFALGETRSTLWALDAHGLTTHDLPPRGDLDPLARRLHGELGTPRGATPRDSTAAVELARLILGPVAAHLTPGRRLVIVADGALAFVPFAALPAPEDGQALVFHHEISLLPSASVLAALRRRPPPVRTGPELVLFADATFGPEWPPLPGSRAEAAALAGLFPAGATRQALGAEATRERARGGALAGARYLHFATHGVFDTERPARSGLQLAGADGFLSLRDVYGLTLDAEMVVLSGCRTALGQEVRGEGLVGLARAFLAAGTSRVVASLWPVDDHATVVLMTRFYRGLQAGERPAAALGAAQRELAAERRWRDPYFWAPWVLVGDTAAPAAGANR